MTVKNNCPADTGPIYARGENTDETVLPNSNQQIATGQEWSTTLPVNWTSGRVWLCPFDTSGLHPWTKDGNEFSYGCSYFEATSGLDGDGTPYVNMDVSYIQGIWLPIQIRNSGGTCAGAGCKASCQSKPTLAKIESDCPTGFWGKYNSKFCLGMSAFCDPGLGPTFFKTSQYCKQQYYAEQLDVCHNQYTQCKGQNPTPFQIYGCGNGSQWLTGGFGQKVCAALNRGVVGNQANWSEPATFYPDGVASNTYAKWIHKDLGCLAYAFSYDDTSVEQSGDRAYYDNGSRPLEIEVELCPWN